MTDREAMNIIADWMEVMDPTLNESLPGWVWDLTAVLDDLLVETGRKHD